MSWAVIQTVPEYYPEGDTSRPKTTEFTAWIFTEKKAAESHKADLLIAHIDGIYTVEKTDREAWDIPALRKTEKKEKKEKEATPPPAAE